MRVLGSFIPSYEKTPGAQKAQNAHQQTKTKIAFLWAYQSTYILSFRITKEKSLKGKKGKYLN